MFASRHSIEFIHIFCSVSVRLSLFVTGKSSHGEKEKVWQEYIIYI